MEGKTPTGRLLSMKERMAKKDQLWSMDQLKKKERLPMRGGATVRMQPPVGGQQPAGRSPPTEEECALAEAFVVLKQPIKGVGALTNCHSHPHGHISQPAHGE